MNPLDWPVVPRLGWTLIHSLWQGLLVIVLLSIVLGLLRRRSAQARYVAGCAALVLLIGLPMLTFTAEDPANGPGAVTSFPADMVRLSGGAVGFSDRYAEESEPTIRLPQQKRTHLLEPLLPWLVTGWLAGVALLSLRLAAGWSQVQRLRHEQVRPVSEPWSTRLADLATKLGVSWAVTLVESALVEVPTVLGWLRPVVLLPASALSGLTPEQLAVVLAHELAHIRRNDYLVNLLQTVVETLLFYHPAVWWVSALVRQERENCCDDLVVATCGDRLLYARALIRLEELRHEMPAPLPALGMAANGGVLLHRIRRLLGLPGSSPRRPARWAAGALILAGLLASIVGVAISAVPEDADGKNGKTKQGATPVRIGIAVGRDTVRQGDAVTLTVTYTNTSKTPVTLWANGSAPGPGFPGETFEITQDGTRRSYTVHAIDPQAVEVRIEPGKSWRRKFEDLGEDLARLDGAAPGPFNAPGEYTIRLRYEPTVKGPPKGVLAESVQSNEVKLTTR